MGRLHERKKGVRGLPKEAFAFPLLSSSVVGGKKPKAGLSVLKEPNGDGGGCRGGKKSYSLLSMG